MSYSKEEALEFLFKQKYDPEKPRTEIPFTREEVRDAIIATGGQVPLNLNNFVKDLTRHGNSDPRSPSAREAGYYLREGSHRGSMGVFFKDSGPLAGSIAVVCPPDLAPKPVSVSIPSEIFDIIRPDEGGLLAVLEYGHLLDDFFEVPVGTVKRVQSPVKFHPHEIDSLFLMKEDDQRILIPCEAKSMGGDAITLNQIVGITAAALQRLLEEDMRIVIPIGAKIEANGDIFVARFPSCRIEDLLVLSSKLKAVNVLKMVRYQLEPKPPRW